MRHVTLSLAVAAMTSTCWAQSERATWLLDVIGGPVTPQNPSVTVRVSAGFPHNDWAFAAAWFNVSAADGDWFSALLLPFGAGSREYGRPGTISGSSITEILVLQFHGTLFFANTDNPIAVWEGVWTTRDFKPRDIALTTTTTMFNVFIDPHGPASRSRLDVLDEGRGFIRVVPAPGAPALTALALMLVRRRRRPW